MGASFKVVCVLALATCASAITPSSKPAIVTSRRTVVADKDVAAGPIVVAKSAAKKASFLSAAAGAPKVDYSLLMYFLFWYIGNAIYNMYNTMALKGLWKYGCRTQQC